MAISGVKLTEKQREGILKAIHKTGGLVYPAAEIANVSAVTIYQICRKEPKFKEALEEARKSRMESLVMIAEDKIKDKIKDGDTSCIIYTLKTQGCKRGWEQKDKRDFEPVTINIKDFNDSNKSETDNMVAEKSEKD